MTGPIRASVVCQILAADSATMHGSDRVITHPAPIGNAGQEAITFCSAEGDRAKELILATEAGVVLCRPDAAAMVGSGSTLIAVDNPRLAFIKVVDELFAVEANPGVHPLASIDPAATIDDSASVGPFCYVGPGCSVGAGTVIHGHVFIGAGAQIGRRATIHAGAVIGADGFAYERDSDGTLVKFPHLGSVVIEDDVEIGANTCVDRGTLGDTVIQQGAKVDNLIHVAHNVVVGRGAVVIANAMIGGSTRIGDQAWIAPSVSLRDGLSIGDGALVGLGSVVVKDVEPGVTVVGAPARPSADYMRTLAALKQLSIDPEPAPDP